MFSGAGRSLVPNAQGLNGSATLATAVVGNGPRPLPRMFKGVTLDNVDGISSSQLAQQINVLQSFSAANPSNTNLWPIVRVASDPDGSLYTNATNSLAGVRSLYAPSSRSFVMMQIMDSSDMPISLSTWESRVNNYLSVLSPYVDLWEVGNEVNGDWTGPISTQIACIEYACAQVKARGGKTALTLYYNPVSPGFCENSNAYSWTNWLNNNGPALRSMEIDYLLISWYEDGCGGFVVPSSSWPAIFEDLHNRFPNVKFFGFGERGTANAGTGSRQSTIINRSYTSDHFAMLGSALRPMWVGGNFWWYFAEECVPATTFTAQIRTAVAAWPTS